MERPPPIPRSRLSGIGFHVPERVVTNRDLERLMDTSDAWIVERTGIRERRFVEPGTGPAELGVEAARRALADAGRNPADVDFVVFATTTPDYVFPGSGVLVQHAMGMGPVGALDVRDQCTGFLYGLAVADAFVRIGMHRCVLVIGAEVQSTGLDLTRAGRDMAVLFGDGAGAAVVEPSSDERGILDWALHGDGRHFRELWGELPSSRLPGRISAAAMAEGRHYPQMNGRQVFKHAVARFPEVIREVLARAGHRLEELALIVPHQANRRISDAVAGHLGVPPERLFQNIERYGNTTAASIPIALAEAREQGQVRPGYLVMLAAFGSGFTWGATLVRW